MNCRLADSISSNRGAMRTVNHARPPFRGPRPSRPEVIAPAGSGRANSEPSGSSSPRQCTRPLSLAPSRRRRFRLIVPMDAARARPDQDRPDPSTRVVPVAPTSQVQFATPQDTAHPKPAAAIRDVLVAERSCSIDAVFEPVDLDLEILDSTFRRLSRYSRRESTVPCSPSTPRSLTPHVLESSQSSPCRTGPPTALRPLKVVNADRAATTACLVSDGQAGCALFVELPTRVVNRLICFTASRGRPHDFFHANL